VNEKKNDLSSASRPSEPSRAIGDWCVLWKPESISTSRPTPVSFPQLAEFVVVTTAQPIRDLPQLDAILKCPPTLDMMEKILYMSPLTADHFRIGVAIVGTFAVWVHSREGKHSLVIPRGYGGPEGNFDITNDSDNPCLNLAIRLTEITLGRAIPAESVLQHGVKTTHGDFMVFAFGVTTRCDVCGHPVDRGEGFILSAKQIVSNPHYWRVRYERNKEHWDEKGISSFDQYRSSRIARDSEVRIVTSMGGGWLVCDNCIKQFAVVDHEVARQFAAAWWSNRSLKVPKDWVATPSDVDMG
jgi:hypothetical protein